MNNKGFAVTGILYTVLVIFLVSITIMLFNLQNRKTILDTLKADTVEAVEENNNFEYLLQRIEELEGKTATVDTIYPVGSVYITTSNVNPSELFPGTEWSSYSEGRTLVGANGTTYTLGSTGGSSSVTLAVGNLPSHSHSIPSLSGSAASNGAHTHAFNNGGIAMVVYANSDNSALPRDSGFVSSINSWWSGVKKNIGSISSAGAHTHSVTTTASTSGSTGSGTAFSVQNPYVVVYMWKRIK